MATDHEKPTMRIPPASRPGVFDLVLLRINQAVGIVCGFFMACLIAIALMQVFYRYVLLQPLVWSEEAARYLLVWISFLGAGLAIGKRLHPNVEVFVERLATRHRRWVGAAVSLVVLCFLVTLIWVGGELTILYSRYTSEGMGISQGWPRLAIPAGAAVMAINVIKHIYDDLSDRSG